MTSNWCKLLHLDNKPCKDDCKNMVLTFKNQNPIYRAESLPLGSYGDL